MNITMENFEQIAGKIKWKGHGLLPVVVQDVESREVLMQAYMNREALYRTVVGGRMCFYSRKRKELWLKGETSGHFQELVEIRLDCDNDCLLGIVRQQGVACHTGHFSCFHKVLGPVERSSEEQETLETPEVWAGEAGIDLEGAGGDFDFLVVGEPGRRPQGEGCSQSRQQDPQLAQSSQLGQPSPLKRPKQQPEDLGAVLQELAEVIAQRKKEKPEGAYTTYLFDKGLDKILKKVGEEAAEVVIAAKNPSQEELVYEVADLFYHTLVLLEEKGVSLDRVKEELWGRRK